MSSELSLIRTGRGRKWNSLTIKLYHPESRGRVFKPRIIMWNLRLQRNRRLFQIKEEDYRRHHTKIGEVETKILLVNSQAVDTRELYRGNDSLRTHRGHFTIFRVKCNNRYGIQDLLGMEWHKEVYINTIEVYSNTTRLPHRTPSGTELLNLIPE